METYPRSPRSWSSLDPWFARLFGDDQPTAVGSGWPGGVVAVLAGALALGGVLCLRFPATLTAPSLRAIYPLQAVRLAIGALLALAFVLGASSALLRRRKALGATAIALGGVALSLGGPRVPLPAVIGRGAGIALDWFLLNALIMTAIFVPLERLAPRDPAQPVFRRGWSTDAVYTLVGHASIQVVSALVVIPGQLLRDRVLGAAALGRLPLWAQLPLVLMVADLAFYWIHRAAHRFPALWRLHRLHHSSEALDWLASERLHLAEVVIVRALVLVPLTLLGFMQTAILAYVTFASFHAVFVHANFRPALRWLEPVLMTPRLHHLHHATDPDAIDRNFAIHLPIIDRLFGTLFAPRGRWPSRMGAVGFRAPEGFWGQQVSVFARATRLRIPVSVVVLAIAVCACAGCGAGAPTISSGLKIFVTSRVHDGDFAGDDCLTGQNAIEKADDFCQTDPNRPDDGAYEALLVDGVTRDALAPLGWVVKPETAYFQPANDVRIAVTTSAALFPRMLDHDIHDSFGTSNDPNAPPPTSLVWTGFADHDSFRAGAQNCRGWTFAENADFAPYGVSYGTDGSEWYTNGGQVCSLTARIYCVEQ